MMEGGPLLSVSDLTVVRSGRVVLDHFSLTMEPGDTVVLLGEAGAGKSALLRVLGGFPDRADNAAGTIGFAGQLPRSVTKRLKAPIRIAYLPSPLAQPLAPHASVLKQLTRVVARKLGAPLGSAREELRLALERFPGGVTPELLDTKPARLDPVARAIAFLAAMSAQTPDLVLADETMADLGPTAVKLLLETLKAEQKRLRFALIYATGGLEPAARLGGRVVVLRAGKVVEEGDADRLMSGHAHTYTRSLFRALPKLDFDAPKPRTIARGQPLLRVFGFSFLANTPVREGLTFELRRGASLALVGEEGSGRRALLRALLAIDRAPAGKVLFDAVDLNMLSPAMAARIRRRIAFITGSDVSLDPRMSLWDTVEEPLRAHLSLSGNLMAAYCDSALKRVGLSSHDGKHPVSSLTAFDKRRLQVARAIVSAPLLVVVDEPLRGLDAFAQTIMREVLSDFRVNQDPAFLVITSDFTVAQALADDAMVFDRGRIVERAPVAQMVRAPQHDATKALIEAVTLPNLSQDALTV